MKFNWANPKDDIHFCNDGAGKVEPGKKPGTYRAEVFSEGSLVAKLEECSGLHSAKQVVEAKLEQLTRAAEGQGF